MATTGGGVPRGATKPFQPITSKPGSPDWAIDGTSGTSGEGSREVTPSPRTVPPAICDCATDAMENIIWVAPPTTAPSAELASR